jgi:hypothetical protein
MTSELESERSAYDYVTKGKVPPPGVVEETLKREKIREILNSVKGKTPHEQYLALLKNHIPIPNWPEDNRPSGLVHGGMEGGKPARLE